MEGGRKKKFQLQKGDSHSDRLTRNPAGEGSATPDLLMREEL